LRIMRERFLDPMKVLAEVRCKSEAVKQAGDRIDYITFVAEGEPTLDVGLSLKIELLKHLGHKIAVISNGSLLWKEDIRQDLAKADLVSLKVDSVREDAWRAVNRPHKDLKLDAILGGLRKFAGEYRGRLVTQTMLVAGINDNPDHVQEVSRFVASLKPATAYLSVPTKPPAEMNVMAPDESVVKACFKAFARELPQADILAGAESGAFFYSGDLEADLLGITAVHPMREHDVRGMVAKANADWSVVEKLLAKGRLSETVRGGEKFYARCASDKTDDRIGAE